MLHPRTNSPDISPLEEDRALFKTPPIWLDVQVTPHISRNAQGDYAIKGFVKKDAEIEVLFAGRRRSAAEPVINRMRVLWQQAYRANKDVKAASVRHTLRLNGSWRPRFHHDEQGWMTRSYQLVVAQWAEADASGHDTIHGAEPILHAPSEVFDEPFVKRIGV